MLILTIRTDRPEAEIGLFDNERQLARKAWQAHRQLAETIHQEIRELLASQNKAINDIEAVAVFKGPGSFTGLRIGVSVANAFAENINGGVPIVGTNGTDWIQHAISKLSKNTSDLFVIPCYGAAPHVTTPKT